MFGHLDDPSPPGATARTVAAVLARSAALRRRRLLSALAVAGCGALALGVVIGLTVSAPGAAPTYAAFDSQAGLLARGTAVPPSDLVSVVFVDDLRGFGLALHHGDSVLASSTDGGDTWSVVDPSLPVGFPAQFEFADAQRGYLWGGPPSPTGTVALWVTADGGRSWRQAPVGPVVSDVSAIGPDVWAVVGTCPVTATATVPCPVVVQVSLDDGTTWAATSATPPLSEDPGVTVNDQSIELARITTARAYVLSFASVSGSGGLGLVAFTGDGGRSWTRRVDPCPRPFDDGEQLAASGTGDLWMMCASQATAGSQAKALYRSHDGGSSWTLAAAANDPVLTGGAVVPAAGGLPTEGYVAPYSLGHENLAVLTPELAWLFPDRAGGVFHTTDGGQTWSVVATLAQAGLVGQGTGNVVFVDATHGWVCEAGTGLWRTTDGITWARLGP